MEEGEAHYHHQKLMSASSAATAFLGGGGGGGGGKMMMGGGGGGGGGGSSASSSTSTAAAGGGTDRGGGQSMLSSLRSLSGSSEGDRDDEDDDDYDEEDEESLTDSLEEGGGAGGAARRSARAARKVARREAFTSLSSDEKMERRKERARMYSHIARKRQESNMKELKAEMECLTVYRLIIEESPDMIAVLGPDTEGRVLFANAAFARGMEAMPGGYMGKPIWSVVHEAHRGELMHAVRSIILKTESASRLTCQGKYPHPDHPGQGAMDLAMRHSPTGIICYLRRAQFEVGGGGGGGGGAGGGGGGGGMEHRGVGGLRPET